LALYCPYKYSTKRTVKGLRPLLVHTEELKGGAENAGVENAGVENAGVDCRGGKCRSGKSGSR